MKKKKEATQLTPMQEFINRQTAMIKKEAYTKRRALVHYRDGFVPTNHVQVLSDEQLTEYSSRIKRLITVLNCLGLRFSMYADGMKEIFYDIKGSSAKINTMLEAVKRVEVGMINCQQSIGALWKAVQVFTTEKEGDITLLNDNMMEEFVKVCFSTDRVGRETAKDDILVKMPISFYETQCVGNPVFRTFEKFGGGMVL